jgi:hypothetical protein
VTGINPGVGEGVGSGVGNGVGITNKGSGTNPIWEAGIWGASRVTKNCGKTTYNPIMIITAKNDRKKLKKTRRTI